jgi:DNA-binding Xre family transcriptional regulator
MMKDFNKHTFISPPVAPNRPSNTKGVLAVIGFWGLTAAVVVATVTAFNYVQTNHNSGLAFAVFAVLVAVSYKKLFHLLIEKNMTNAQLQQEAGFSANIITRLKRNGYISLESVESICRVLNCGVDDILEFVPEDNGGKENG